MLQFITQVYEQLFNNFDVILKSAATYLSLVTAVYTFWRYWDFRRKQTLSEKNVSLEELSVLAQQARERVDAAILESKQARPERKPERPRRNKPPTQAEQLQTIVQQMEARTDKLLEVHGRRGQWWSFLQGFIWFILGTITSLLMPKFFP